MIVEKILRIKNSDAIEEDCFYRLVDGNRIEYIPTDNTRDEFTWSEPDFLYAENRVALEVFFGVKLDYDEP